jgi:TRAP-type mannitol/chloroaromatic compound transport system permease small subunit
VGGTVRWLTLAIPLVCFTYAVFRKLFPWGHNGFSELQWYLFATVYLLAAGYTLLKDQHVRVDFFWRGYSTSTKCAVDIVFLLALMIVCIHLTVSYWSYATLSLARREGPEDVLIGLERWPIKFALFLGFGLFALQSLGETLKRVAVLKHWIPAADVYPAESPVFLPTTSHEGR